MDFYPPNPRSNDIGSTPIYRALVQHLMHPRFRDFWRGKSGSTAQATQTLSIQHNTEHKMQEACFSLQKVQRDHVVPTTVVPMVVVVGWGLLRALLCYLAVRSVVVVRRQGINSNQ
jgi:hypothetical protein